VIDQIVSGVIQGINGIIHQRQVNAWLKLLIELMLAFWITFWTVLGTTLTALLQFKPDTLGWDFLSALAAASAAAAGATFYHWRRSPLTRGMSVTVPQSLQQPENLQHVEHR
jgi:hypothetical protein